VVSPITTPEPWSMKKRRPMVDHAEKTPLAN
jgi:hypothetical protein